MRMEVDNMCAKTQIRGLKEKDGLLKVEDSELASWVSSSASQAIVDISKKSSSNFGGVFDQKAK